MSENTFNAFIENRAQVFEEDITTLIKAGGFLIGSRALGVADEHTDWDIAILRDNLPGEFIQFKELDPSEYFSVLPMLNSSLIRLQNIDILIYDDSKDFAAVMEALALTKQCPKSLLAHKGFRVYAFETALQLTGRFKPIG